MNNQHFKARDILRKAFPGIPELEAEELVSYGSMQSYNPGKVLCKEGAFEFTFFIILEGCVSVTKVINDVENRQHIHYNSGCCRRIQKCVFLSNHPMFPCF